MRRFPSLLLAGLFGTAGYAQYWKNVGLGPTGIGPPQVTTLFADTVTDQLLAGGPFFFMANEEDTVLGVGQAAWNGFRWDSLATRITPDNSLEVAPDTYWFLRYQGRLYACGNFYFPTPDGYNKNFARLNEQTTEWEALECINTGFSGLTSLVPKEPQDILYATGPQGDLCQMFPPTCVYTYDGAVFARWEPFDLIAEVNNRRVTYIFEYKDKTYMVGLFPDPTGPGTASFLRYNGIGWEHVPGWGNLIASIWDYSVRNDTLYVAGDFQSTTGGPGNLVASFDGEQWSNMGGGMSAEETVYQGTMKALQWFHGELWACGLFDHAGGVSASGIAKWDGHQWCVPPGAFFNYPDWPPTLNDMAVWRDSLYVCGIFTVVGGVPINKVAQWAGGDEVENCGVVGISEKPIPLRLRITSTGAGQWNVHFPFNGNWTLTAYDATGRQVGTWSTTRSGQPINLARQASGIYLLRATEAGGTVLSGKVYRP